MTSLLIKTLEKPFEGVTDISEEEQSLIIGGLCYYGGISYSPGSTVSMPSPNGGDVVKTCQPDDTWKKSI
jgi:hypothetical protein